MKSTLQRIDSRLAELEPGSLRFRLLTALRQFRAGWVELGRLLNQVAFDGDYKDWGYDDFEVYCARELGLKRPTVQKLMLSYNYMKQHEPGRLHAFEDAQSRPGGPADLVPGIPDYQTVDLLDKARRRAQSGQPSFGEDDARDFHQRAFASSGDEGGELMERELRRELRDRLRPAARPLDHDSPHGQAALLRLARSLRERLPSHRGWLPSALYGRLEAALSELEALAPEDGE